MSKANTVTLTRSDYEALVDRVEDADDRVTVAAAEAREKVLGVKAARADALPLVWSKHSRADLIQRAYGASIVR